MCRLRGGGYVRFTNGLQICYFEVKLSSNNQSNINLPAAFVNSNWIGVCCGPRANYGNESIKPQSNTTFQLLGETNANPHKCIAIGKWK